MLAATKMIAALTAVSFATLGGGGHAFADSANFTQNVVLEQGGTGPGENPVGFFGREALT